MDDMLQELRREEAMRSTLAPVPSQALFSTTSQQSESPKKKKQGTIKSILGIFGKKKKDEDIPQKAKSPKTTKPRQLVKDQKSNFGTFNAPINQNPEQFFVDEMI